MGCSTMRGFGRGCLVFMLGAALWPMAARGQFVAYNDLSGAGAGSSAGNVTNLSINDSGALVDYTTGTPTSVTLSLSAVDATRDDSFSVTDYSAGDILTEFGTILNNNGYVRHNTETAASLLTATFTGLNPAKRYTVVVASDRAGGTSASYANRTARFSILDVDAFVNSSSVGIPNVGANWVEYNTGNNAAGYVARFSDIQSGADGDMVLTIGAGPLGDRRWYVNGLKLIEVPEPATGLVFALGFGAVLLKRGRRSC